MVSSTPPVTTMTLLSRYWPMPLSQALAKFDHSKVSGSAHGQPKIAREVLHGGEQGPHERDQHPWPTPWIGGVGET